MPAMNAKQLADALQSGATTTNAPVKARLNSSSDAREYEVSGYSNGVITLEEAKNTTNS